MSYIKHIFLKIKKITKDYILIINLSLFCLSGGMVDAADSKSVGAIRAGSSPV
ncbi:Hypothetical protein MCYN_0300 [Mycoplasmopsis cynos C142]|uniref:Uncharacterized protein n=1 Tax=Mycoplasmopsis cynos (strain C142) TaxID=1246955 RepID=L0RVD1_MYCC1|nr:Hypothetical protein MCYN_0300 [Mycoplasmopsis cynos C142]